MRRYRLKIPKMIRREDAWCADYFNGLHKQPDYITEDWNGERFDFGCIPTDWIEEIIECCKCGKNVSNGDWDWLDDWKENRICEDCFNASIKDEPTVTPEEALGYAHSWCCSKLDKGEDPRKIEVPQLLEDWRERNNTKIPDEPMSAEEVIRDILGIEKRECVHSGHYVVTWKNLVSLVNAGATEERKKHRSQQTFQEWLKNETSGLHDKTCPRATKKDKSMNAEEWDSSFETWQDIGVDPYNETEQRIACFNAGAAENEKKHRLQQSFEEWDKHKITPIRTGMSPQEILKLGREQGWQAHAKATNTED